MHQLTLSGALADVYSLENLGGMMPDVPVSDYPTVVEFLVHCCRRVWGCQHLHHYVAGVGKKTSVVETYEYALHLRALCSLHGLLDKARMILALQLLSH